MHRVTSVRLSVLAALSAALVACNWPTDKPYLANRDPPPLQMTATTPVNGSDGVALNSAVVFFFDAPLHPDAVSRQTVWLSAGPDEISASRSVHLLDCTVTLRPHEPLSPQLFHRAEVADLYGFTAGPLPTASGDELAVVFTTGDATDPEPAPNPVSLQQVHSRVLAPRCASCHTGTLPPAGLDLSTEAAAAAGLISVESPLVPGATRVVPGRHSASYLMWKLLDLPTVFGDPMPPEGDWPTDRGCATTDAELRLVADWIDSL